MKKVLTVAVVLVAVALLPLIGNKVVQRTIQNRLEVLSSYGLHSTLLQEQKDYLHTKLRYRFKIQDKKKFLHYLQQFSLRQLPPYTQNLLDGVVFGMNLEYSNIPFNETLQIDLYPVQLPPRVMSDLQKKNPNIYKLIEEILQNKEILYHIEYAVVNGEFQGHLKDFRKSITLKNANTLEVKFLGVQASGKGMLLAPDKLDTKVDRFFVKVMQKDSAEVIWFDLKDLTSHTTFQNDTSFESLINIASFVVHVQPKKTNSAFEMKLLGVALKSSANTQATDVKATSRLSMEKFELASAKKALTLEQLVFDLNLEGLEKHSYIALQKLFEKLSTNGNIQKEDEIQMQKNIESLLAHGLTITIPEFSLAKIALNTKKQMDGFTINFKMHLKKDSALVQKLQTGSKALVENILLHADMRFSKAFYALLNRIYPIDLMIATLKKEQKDQVVFTIDMQGRKVQVNGKQIR